MSGIKGQKWGTDRPDPRIKKSVSLKVEYYKIIEKMALEKRWTISSTIEFVVEEYLKERS